MKTKTLARRILKGGYALLMVMIIVGICILVLASTMGRTGTTSKINDRDNEYTANLYAAEAATEKVIAQMKNDFMIGGLGTITNKIGNGSYGNSPPSSSEYSYWSNYRFSDAQGNSGKTFVGVLSSSSWGALQSSQYVGLYGWTNDYRVLSNVQRVNSPYGVIGAVQQDIEMAQIPVFQFAIFYNSLLEFTWAAPLTVNGRTHANSSIFVGSSSPLTFNSLVTCSGWLGKTNWGGYTTSQFTGAINYNGGYSTNTQVLVLPIGTNNTPAAVQQVIDMPPVGEDPGSALGSQRYYNKAEVLLLVSNSTVTAILRTGTNDAGPTTITATYFPTNTSPTNYAQVTTNFPFLNLTNTFYDQRESKTVKATQIDMGVLKNWSVTNSAMKTKFPYGAGGVYDVNTTVPPDIMYVADNRTPGPNTNLYSVRLTDATVIPTNMIATGASGFTVATPNPLYVYGNYNCPDPNALNKVDASKAFPASLVSDALTVLSPNWVDSQSAIILGGSGKNAANSTTINAALLAGVVYSAGSTGVPFSGGVVNYPRLLEDWGSGGAVTLTLNTSIVNFFNSIRATNVWQTPGIYYQAPTRQFSFNTNYTQATKMPPGTPTLNVVNRKKWTIPPPNTTTYAGN